MPSKGFDCSTPLTETTAAAFAADGYEFVCRYLVPSGWKALTKAEVDLICAVGLHIVSVFETSADRALGGYGAGLADGATAASVAEQVGQPEGTVIYFAVDFDAQPGQMRTVINYLRGCAHATPTFRTGVYGSYSVVEAVQASGVCSQFWQTRAWSRGQISDHANIYQYDCGPDGSGMMMHGIKVDLNEGFGDEGGWTINQKTLQEADDTMQLEQWQWKMLGDSLDGLYHKGLLGDYGWAEKAYKGELTQTELAFLNTVVLAREKGVEV